MQKHVSARKTEQVLHEMRGKIMKQKNMQLVSFCLLLVLLFLGVKGAETAKAEETVSFTLHKTTLLMKPGNTRTLTVKKSVLVTGSAIEEESSLSEDTTTGTAVIWSSSNPKVATVNQKGKVMAKKAGKAIITVQCGDAKATCKVTVAKNQWDYLLERYKSNSKVKQLIFVKYKGNSKARVLLYQKKAGTWKKTLSCVGNVGKNGIGKKQEGDKKTPTGTFNLPMAFGIQRNPGTKLPYTKVKSYHYWCSDPSYYNQLIDIRTHAHSCSGEHLINYRGYYDYGVFIDYNKEGIYPKGSAIFLHCQKRGESTSGCISVSKGNMKKILRSLSKGAKICIYKE